MTTRKKENQKQTEDYLGIKSLSLNWLMIVCQMKNCWKLFFFYRRVAASATETDLRAFKGRQKSVLKYDYVLNVSKVILHDLFAILTFKLKTHRRYSSMISIDI